MPPETRLNLTIKPRMMIRKTKLIWSVIWLLVPLVVWGQSTKSPMQVFFKDANGDAKNGTIGWVLYEIDENDNATQLAGNKMTFTPGSKKYFQLRIPAKLILPKLGQQKNIFVNMAGKEGMVSPFIISSSGFPVVQDLGDTGDVQGSVNIHLKETITPPSPLLNKLELKFSLSVGKSEDQAGKGTNVQLSYAIEAAKGAISTSDIEETAQAEKAEERNARIATHCDGLLARADELAGKGKYKKAEKKYIDAMGDCEVLSNKVALLQQNLRTKVYEPLFDAAAEEEDARAAFTALKADYPEMETRDPATWKQINEQLAEKPNTDVQGVRKPAVTISRLKIQDRLTGDGRAVITSSGGNKPDAALKVVGTIEVEGEMDGRDIEVVQNGNNIQLAFLEPGTYRLRLGKGPDQIEHLLNVPINSAVKNGIIYDKGEKELRISGGELPLNLSLRIHGDNIPIGTGNNAAGRRLFTGTNFDRINEEIKNKAKGEKFKLRALSGSKTVATIDSEDIIPEDPVIHFEWLLVLFGMIGAVAGFFYYQKLKNKKNSEELERQREAGLEQDRLRQQEEEELTGAGSTIRIKQRGQINIKPQQVPIATEVTPPPPPTSLPVDAAVGAGTVVEGEEAVAKSVIRPFSRGANLSPEILEDPNYYKLELQQQWSSTTVNTILIKFEAIAAIDFAINNLMNQLDMNREANPEMGGFLLGRFGNYSDGSYYVSIDEYVPAEAKKQGVYEVELDLIAADEPMQQNRHLAMVGWFHTHPGHSLFLSSSDLKIHRPHFKHPYQFAMEIEPFTEKIDLAFFTWKTDGELNQSANDRRPETESWLSWEEVNRWRRVRKTYLQ